LYVESSLAEPKVSSCEPKQTNDCVVLGHTDIELANQAGLKW
jgi:hypothetical protein